MANTLIASTLADYKSILIGKPMKATGTIYGEWFYSTITDVTNTTTSSYGSISTINYMLLYDNGLRCFTIPIRYMDDFILTGNINIYGGQLILIDELEALLYCSV